MVRDAASKIFDFPDDHAGEMETSLILAFRPELVARRSDGSLTADAGSVRPMRFEALEKGWGIDHSAMASPDNQLRFRKPTSCVC